MGLASQGCVTGWPCPESVALEWRAKTGLAKYLLPQDTNPNTEVTNKYWSQEITNQDIKQIQRMNLNKSCLDGPAGGGSDHAPAGRCRP